MPPTRALLPRDPGRAAVLLALLFLPGPADAQESRESGFGFTFELADGWMFLNAESAGSDEMAPVMQSLPFGVQQGIRSGQLEIVFRPAEGEADRASTISIARAQGTIPQDPEQLGQQCDLLSTGLSRQLGTEIELEECRLGSVGGAGALLVETSGGTRSLNARIQSEPSVVVMLSGGAADDQFETMRRVFDALLESVTWKE